MHDDESYLESLQQNDWKLTFSNLIHSSSLTKPKSVDLVNKLIVLGKRKKAIKFILFLKKKKLFSKKLCYLHVNCLLVLGRNDKASLLLEKYSKSFNISRKYCDRVRRYIGSSDLRQASADFVELARNLLWLDFRNYLDFGGQSYLKGLEGHCFSDIVVVSNNPALQFHPEELKHIRSMRKPLFVYLNIGNPALGKMRDMFYSSNSYELLIGNPTFLVGDSFRLIFSPFRLTNFIGCFVLARRRMLLFWYSKLRGQILTANPDVDFFHFESLIALQSVYPLSTFRDVHQLLKQRIPTVGCLALMLAYSLSTFSEFCQEQSFTAHDCGFWTVGFSMSPSYLFETCAGNELHDFVFERAVQQYLINNHLMRVLGWSKPFVSERSARQHLVDEGHVVPARRSAFDRAAAWENK